MVYKAFIRWCFANIISLTTACLFLSNSVFCRSYFLILIFFYFMYCTFGVVSENSSPNSRSPRFSSVLSYRSFIDFPVTFWSMIHFDLIFRLNFCIRMSNCSTTICWKDYHFFIEFLCSFVKDQRPIFVWVYIWSLLYSIGLSVCFSSSTMLPWVLYL